MKKTRKTILVLCGPTAVGKTELSLQIAERFSCEIVGVDSMQVYRYMDIGTAKPTFAERARIPHYLIDIVDPDDHYTLGRFVKDASEAIQTIYSHENMPLLQCSLSILLLDNRYHHGCIVHHHPDIVGTARQCGHINLK